MAESQTVLDLSSLPEQARAQLFDFYEFLSQKYNSVLAKEVPAGKVMENQGIGEDDHRADFTDLFGVWSESPPDTAMCINKKYIVDEQGNPREVIISYEDFLRIGEMLDLYLDDEAMNDLRQARSDRESGRKDQYVELDDI